MNSLQKIFFFSLIGILASCSVGPDYIRPPVKVPVKFKEAKNKWVIAPKHKKGTIAWQAAQPQDTCNRGPWWKFFNDPILDSLEDRLNTSNQSILNAFHNYQQARAIVAEAASGYYPTLTGSLSLLRQKNSGSTTFISSSGGTTSTGTATSGAGLGGSSITNSHTWLFDASWEPDIWGLVRRTVESDVAAAQASEALYASTRLSSQATLAQLYFELRGLDAMQQMLNDTVTGYKKSLAITQHQYAAGVAARADVVQAESLLESAQGLAINNGILRAQYEHAIAVLMGLPPAALSISYRPLTAIPPAIPLIVPSLLLERRPDIAQAERLMAEANAQIGVAVAAYYPALTLTGTGSTGARSLGPLTEVPSFSWSLGTQLAETIFDGGLRRATVKAAEEGFCASIANYRQVVLSAFQDVEDNLVSLRTLNDQAVVEQRAVRSAKEAVDITLNQYKSGTVTYTTVITAQINAFNLQQTAITVNYQRMVSAVGLVKALGGSW